MNWILFIGISIFAYLLGSIPFGLLISKSQRVDIRKLGSGNIGATNVFRTLGPKFGVMAFALDFFKGLIPVLLIKFLLPSSPSSALPLDFFQIMAGLFAMLGHIFPIYIGFKGGKGVATAAGLVTGILPIITLILILIWAIITFSTRYVSVASLTVAVLLPISILVKKFVLHYTDPSFYVFFFSIIISLFVIIRHRSNIVRLLNGTENRFGTKKETASQGDTINE
jgi:glycerol-3-phosphate acyltransferase PlsY